MNAIEIIDQVRAHGAELARDGYRLFVRGTGEPLPSDLRDALTARKAELLIALGMPFDQTVQSVLDFIRPHLTPSLQALPDDRLLALVNWHIVAAWQKAMQELERGGH